MLDILYVQNLEGWYMVVWRSHPTSFRRKQP